MTDLHLSTGAPRTADYTRQVADGLAKCVRVLNHHTMDGDAVPDPGVIYDVLGSLQEAVSGLDQLLAQLSDRLAVHALSDRLADTSGAAQGAVTRTRHGITAARESAARLTGQLGYAVQASSSLYLRDGGQ